MSHLCPIELKYYKITLVDNTRAVPKSKLVAFQNRAQNRNLISALFFFSISNFEVVEWHIEKWRNAVWDEFIINLAFWWVFHTPHKNFYVWMEEKIWEIREKIQKSRVKTAQRVRQQFSSSRHKIFDPLITHTHMVLHCHNEASWESNIEKFIVAIIIPIHPAHLSPP